MLSRLMGWEEFVASLVRSLAWPGAIVAVAWIFRDQLRHVLRSWETLRLKYKDLEAEFSRKVVDAETIAAQQELAPPEVEPDPDPASLPLAELAHISPRAGVIEAWLPVEREVQALAMRHDIESRSPLQAANALRAAGVISPGVFELFTELRQIRNYAVHFEDLRIDPREAKRVINLARTVEAELRETP